jgi:hypothetical protein
MVRQVVSPKGLSYHVEHFYAVRNHGQHPTYTFVVFESNLMNESTPNNHDDCGIDRLGVPTTVA